MMLKMEYLAMGILATVVAMIITYLVGERSWGKQQMNVMQIFAFWFYRRVNRIKLIRDKRYKVAILLATMKINNEITSISPNFTSAQHHFARNTKLTLQDIYDDYRGHRYIKIDTPEHGVLIFEIAEYMRVALDKRIKDRTIANAPEGTSADVVKELETKPMLKVIRK